ncbi:Immunoglobulin A1 protease precursor [Anaerohalosphaera lusitana]|uniref:Immunoglobulin A1 protease n=1 Tax=Anaerohalosphaera lusitana TaxID=1936003 RepID=A0A1U9NLY2_9BACT|nr:GLUG motif-containing protein [Anaerohalosphaera lusitana]AQT68496.1 Immunoglobulin A1 protease precursor [Anaerohalosphaera lusitana]
MKPKPSILVVLIITSLQTLAAGYSGGTGTANDPFQIATPSDWQQLCTTVNDWDNSFVLTSDIDLMAASPQPVGNLTTPFTGSLNGDGFTISGASLQMPDTNFIGLFGVINGGRISNLNITALNVSADRMSGGLVGQLAAGDVINCHISGTVAGTSDIGGLIGSSSGNVEYCSSSATVNDAAYTGGLIGTNDGTITRCSAACEVSGVGEAGGLVGRTGDNSVISSCWSTGSLVCSSSSVGGLVGLNRGIVQDCYSHASVAGTGTFKKYFGGLIGWNYSGSQCINSFSTGTVNGGTAPSYVGGLVGRNSASVTACFWNTETSGIPTSSGGFAKTTDQLMDIYTFTDAAWDMQNTWNMGHHQTYPYIRLWQSSDFNRDGIVDMQDLANLAQQWLQ